MGPWDFFINASKGMKCIKGRMEVVVNYGDDMDVFSEVVVKAANLEI